MNIYNRASVCIVDIDNNELELPEELPEFPYEKELAQELQAMIVKYGGSEGANMLKSQASEQLEMMNENRLIDSTVERLTQLIQEFESIGNKSSKSKLSYKTAQNQRKMMVKKHILVQIVIRHSN